MGEKAVGMLVTHPCASRSRTNFSLDEVLAVAPVRKGPKDWGPPWEGHLRYFPLPDLRAGDDYAADLNAVCPVPSEALVNHRIACLNSSGLAALFHRLAMNQIRYPEIPAHFAIEAEKLTTEIDLWEQWVEERGTEDGFQDWLDGTFGGQPYENEYGEIVEGSNEPNGERRSVLAWNRDELFAELETFLAED